jgi:hypothetical protein
MRGSMPGKQANEPVLEDKDWTDPYGTVSTKSVDVLSMATDIPCIEATKIVGHCRDAKPRAVNVLARPLVHDVLVIFLA